MTEAEERDSVQDQLCARIEELEAEKMELNEQLDVAQQERDALAAHLERIQSVERDETEYGRNVMDILDYAPAISLARLKAQWQAEVLDEASNEFEVHERARMVLHWKAQKIRQQATPKPETQP